jgi:hypothetical protein
MGYELNKLMNLYGVSSPTKPSYVGSTDQERANYDAYIRDYNNRLSTTSMYSQPQFQTSLSPALPAQREVLRQPVYQTSATPSAPTLPTVPTVPTGGGSAGPDRGADRPFQYNPDMNIMNNIPRYTPPSFNELPVYNPDLNISTPNVPAVSGRQDFGGGYAGIGRITGIDPLAPRYSGETDIMPYISPSFSEPSTYTPPSFSEMPTYAPPSFNELPAYNPDLNIMSNSPSFSEPARYTPPYFSEPSTYNPDTNIMYTPPVYDLPAYNAEILPDYGFFGGGGRSEFGTQTEMYNKGGPVKKFAIGGLNDMAEDYGISMLPGNEEFQYGPRPKSGPLGSWIQQVGTETVPGVGIAGRARTPERNREVGGVPNSLHLSDDAVDFRPPPNMTQSELLTKLKGEFGPDFDVLPSKGRSVHVEPGPNILKGAPAVVAEQVAPTGELGSMTPPPAEGEAVPTSRAAELQMMLQGYGDESVYADELSAARKKATDEADAFKTMLEASLDSPEDAKASKAEMYFRLAAAFGSPTKTGGFGENLGLASKELADYSKGKRESAQGKLATRMKLQEMRMGAAKEDLNTLRTLSAEEMKDQRAIKQSMIKEYIESGKPQSAAGKQALDEGYKAGTPEFQARVREVSALNVARETAQLDVLLANLKINQNRDLREEKKGEKLTPQELTMKRETEDSLASLTSALDLISKAYTLNPNTFDTSLIDQGRRKALEIAGAKDPKLINTRTLENLLKSQMITSAAEKMKGVLSDSDIKLLTDIQGLEAKSVEERAEILRSAYSVLKSGRTRLQQRLKDVSSGAYRQISGE